MQIDEPLLFGSEGGIEPVKNYYCLNEFQRFVERKFDED